MLAPLLVVETRPVRLPRSPPLAVLVTSGASLASLPVMQVPLLAVGDATARRAREAGWALVESAGGDADALAALVARRYRKQDGTLLLASGRGQGGPLAKELRAHGFTIARRVAYEAAPVSAMPYAAQEALVSGRLRAALFFSAETARVFHRLLPASLAGTLREVDALAIGAPAAAALNAEGWRRVRVASSPTLEGVLALL